MSYILITCREGANPRENRLILRTHVNGALPPEYIYLHPGVNKLDVNDYPALKYGFYNAGFDADNESDYWEASDNCQDIIEIDLRHFDGSEMTDMDSMFYYMFNLERIYLEGLDTSKVESMAFAFCGVGADLKVSSTVDSLKERPSVGFYKDRGMLTFDLSGLSVENIQHFEQLFSHGGGVVNDAANQPIYKLNFNGWKLDSEEGVEDMFSGVNFLAEMSLVDCDKTTVEILSEEWLYEMSGLIRH